MKTMTNFLSKVVFMSAIFKHKGNFIAPRYGERMKVRMTDGSFTGAIMNYGVTNYRLDYIVLKHGHQKMLIFGRDIKDIQMGN